MDIPTMLENVMFYFLHLFGMIYKSLLQKKAQGAYRSLSQLLTPIALFFVFFGIMSLVTRTVNNENVNYDLHDLPYLNTSLSNGAFQGKMEQYNSQYIMNRNADSEFLYSPNTMSDITAMITEFKSLYPDMSFRGFSSLEESIKHRNSNFFKSFIQIHFDLSSNQLSTGQFVDTSASVNHVNYTLYMNDVNLWPKVGTSNVEPTYNKLSNGGDVWQGSGYLTVQNFIDSFIANLDSGVSNFNIATKVQRFPSSSIYEDSPAIDISVARYFIWQWLAPICIFVGFYFPQQSFAAEAVAERQLKLKDLLDISGLNNLAYWSSYIVLALLTCLLSAAFFVMVFYAVPGGGASAIVTSLTANAYVSLTIAYGGALMAQALAFGHLFTAVEYFGLPFFMLNIGMSLAGLFMANNMEMSYHLKSFLGFLMPSLNLCNGVWAIEDYQWSVRNDNPAKTTFDMNKINEDRNIPSLNEVVDVMVLSMFFYLFVAAYYPFTNLINNTKTEIIIPDDLFVFPCDNEEVDAMVSAAERNAKVMVDDRPVLLHSDELTQIYPNTAAKAVSSMSFRIRSGEILGFLGSNGAGKSTTMAMLSGTLSPTGGDAFINNISVRDNKEKARRNLGIAFQTDVIWPDVSIRNHLIFFGILRGLFGKELTQAVDAMLEDLGFPEKQYTPAGKLSGGQKRRLCVGIAMVGQNPVVILDEPTSGLDPVSRRQLWELIQKNREGRAIMLTTHFMDEADILSDKIAIVRDGRMRAYGSSDYLKHKFGLGYLVRFSLATAKTEVSDRILSFIRQSVSDAELVSKAGTELAVRMPKDAVQKFSSLFGGLEDSLGELNIKSFGIETTTLEEVFINLINEDLDMYKENPSLASRMIGATRHERETNELMQRMVKKEKDSRSMLTDDEKDLLLTKGRNTNHAVVKMPEFATISQIGPMMMKRFKQFSRSKGQFIFAFLLPIGLSIIAAIVMNAYPSRLLSPEYNPVNTDECFVPSAPILFSGPQGKDVTSGYVNATGILDNGGTATYAGTSYSDMFDYVTSSPTLSPPEIASDAVYFGSQSNFSILYNATYALNFACLSASLNKASVAAETSSSDNIVINHSFNKMPYAALNPQLNYMIFFVMIIGVHAGSIGAALVLVLGGERTGLVKHQQLSAGARTLAYWIANFLYDFLTFMFHIIILGIALTNSGNPSLDNGESFGVIFSVGIIYSIAATFRAQLLTFVISDIKIAQSVFLYGNIFWLFVLEFIFLNTWLGSGGAADFDIMQPTPQILLCVLTIFDPSFGYAFVLLFQSDFVGVRSFNNDQSTFIASELIIVGLVAHAMIALALLVYAEAGIRIYRKFMTYCCCMWSELGVDKSNFDPDRDDYRPTSSNEILTRVDNINEIREYSDNTLDKDFILDPDVELERNFILNEICKKKRLNLRRDSILMKGLQKTYFGDGNLIKDKNAVKGQYLSVGVGECFALLGANGAGKTTTFKMCTGLEDPTSGTAFVNGYDIVRSRSRAQRSMGLCPQFDTLIERLSVAENILYFARMKGLKAEDAPRIMQVYMKALNIKKFEHMSVLQLSGGTRRKVSLIVALLGCPPAIFLDEPSTGLDPVASRLMWNLLTLVRDAKQTAMVLTTHNMLECESVCTRIGVMKNGELVCIGDSQHLRSRHGTGFLLNIRVEAEQYTEAVKSFVRTEFAESVVIDEYATHLHYEIKSDKKLSEMFRLFEENKDQLHVVEYVLSQSSLEQVFLKKIRSNEGDEIEEESVDDIMKKVPVKCRDYFYGYFMLAMTVIIPGAHHFWLKDWYMGFYYFFTLNLLYIGTILDFFRMTFLLKRSIMKHGHVKIGFCGCWFPNCRRCCSKCCAPFGWVDDAEVNDNNLGNDDIPRPSQQRFDIENPFIGSGQTITTTQDVVEQIDGEAASNVGEGVSAVAEFGFI